MTTGAPVRKLAWAVRSAIRPLRPQSYWQVWLSATAVPSAVLVIGIGLKMAFHTWPQFDVPSAVGTASYVVLVGGRQSLALHQRRRARCR
jgi:hypothetical protein